MATLEDLLNPQAAAKLLENIRQGVASGVYSQAEADSFLSSATASLEAMSRHANWQDLKVEMIYAAAQSPMEFARDVETYVELYAPSAFEEFSRNRFVLGVRGQGYKGAIPQAADEAERLEEALQAVNQAVEKQKSFDQFMDKLPAMSNLDNVQDAIAVARADALNAVTVTQIEEKAAIYSQVVETAYGRMDSQIAEILETYGYKASREMIAITRGGAVNAVKTMEEAVALADDPATQDVIRSAIREVIGASDIKNIAQFKNVAEAITRGVDGCYLEGQLEQRDQLVAYMRNAVDGVINPSAGRQAAQATRVVAEAGGVAAEEIAEEVVGDAAKMVAIKAAAKKAAGAVARVIPVLGPVVAGGFAASNTAHAAEAGLTPEQLAAVAVGETGTAAASMLPFLGGEMTAQAARDMQVAAGVPEANRTGTLRSSLADLMGAVILPEGYAQNMAANHRAAATLESYMNSLPSEAPSGASPELLKMVELKHHVMAADAAMKQAGGNLVGGVASQRQALEEAQAAFAAYYGEQQGNLPMTPEMQALAAAKPIHDGNASIPSDAAEAQRVVRTGEAAPVRS